MNGFPLSILIDTGAEVSLLSDASFNRINRNGCIKFSKPLCILVHYLKGSIPVLGCFHANVVSNDRFATFMFYVVHKFRSLPGVDVVHDLKLILLGVPLKCFQIDAGAPETAVPGHVTEAEVLQPQSTADSNPPSHSFGCLWHFVVGCAHKPTSVRRFWRPCVVCGVSGGGLCTSPRPLHTVN